jgi:hypothetical protein
MDSANLINDNDSQLKIFSRQEIGDATTINCERVGLDRCVEPAL